MAPGAWSVTADVGPVGYRLHTCDDGRLCFFCCRQMVGRLVLETLPAVADDPADVGSVMAVVSRLADDPGECHKNSVSSCVLVFFKLWLLSR